ncbi:MAG: hypothetical protein FWF49_02995 [Oscillospiraceae bacterium]|nr:hypothetical protein [Oscillospiraceae bacterium]
MNKKEARLGTEEFFKIVDCKEFHEQYRIISECVQQAMDNWVRTDLANRYKESDFETICLCVANEISSRSIRNKSIHPEIIAEIIMDNYFDEFEDEMFTKDYCSKVAMQIFQKLDRAFLEHPRFILPEYVRAY